MACCTKCVVVRTHEVSRTVQYCQQNVLVGPVCAALRFPRFFACASGRFVCFLCLLCRKSVHNRYHDSALSRLADPLQVTTLEQRCQKLESEVQKLAQTWSEAAPAEEIKVSPPAIMQRRSLLIGLLPDQRHGQN